MMTNTLSPEMRRHIESLQFHCAMVGNDTRKRPLTEQLVEETVEYCKQNGYIAVAFDMTLDGINEPMMLAVWKNGHVDSGSVKNIMDCLAYNSLEGGE